MYVISYISFFVRMSYSKTYYSWGSGILYLALKSGMNTEAENSENHRVSRTLFFLSHPNVAGAISGYKAVVAQPSSLGILWHVHMWNLHAGIFRAFRGTSCTVSDKCFYILAEHSFPRAVTLSKRRQACLVKIEFQSVPS